MTEGGMLQMRGSGTKVEKVRTGGEGDVSDALSMEDAEGAGELCSVAMGGGDG